MTEHLLQFIWQFQYFDKGALCTKNGETLLLNFQGTYNTNQGPDFLNAKIKIGNTTWAGNIELHIKSSDWKKHKHHKDNNYENVMLHVVWEDDAKDNSLPVLELKGRVSKILLHRFEEMMQQATFIPCERLIDTVKSITWTNWKDRLLAERLLRKSKIAIEFAQENNYHWEETFWWLLARNFGLKVNSDVFESMARSVSISILAKHKSQIHQLEALLFGQAGLLDGKFVDDYPILLQKEYLFLKQKYGLQAIHQRLFFLRMRPGNFPTIRLAQLAALIHNASHLFSKIKEAAEVKDVKAMFAIVANDYWNYHYKFDISSKYKIKELGPTMVDNIIINTICPLLFAYGSYHNDERLKNKAMKWLEGCKAESNRITKGFNSLGIKNKTAYDSQALIELKNEYCILKRCLDCAIGNAILKQQ